LEFIYLLVALFSTTIGALSGLGGGVIIKPVLDSLGQYDVATIGLLSSFTVLSMAVVSTIKQYHSGMRFEGKTTIILSSGSITGGILGTVLFSYIRIHIEEPRLITAVQSVILALLLILVLIYLLKKNIHSFHMTNVILIFIVGLLLGLIASFLGVGGGPFNVVLLALLFSMDSKSAAVHSVLIILFSQSSKLLSVLISTGFSGFDLSMLFFMIPGGIIGGLSGSFLNRKLKSETIQILFRVVIVLIILLNLVNLYKSLI